MKISHVAGCAALVLIGACESGYRSDERTPRPVLKDIPEQRSQTTSELPVARTRPQAVAEAEQQDRDIDRDNNGQIPSTADSSGDSKTRSRNEPAREIDAAKTANTPRQISAGQAEQNKLSALLRTAKTTHYSPATVAPATPGRIAPPAETYPLPDGYPQTNRENYEQFKDNGVHWAAQTPVSTFSIDVDTAAYANVRRMLNQGQLPPADAIRVEELINYFSYDYPRATDQSEPFSIYTEMGPSPWAKDRKLLHVGINGWQPDTAAAQPPANLVFLIDVSGSMRSPNKIELLKSAMKMMADQLRQEDRISIAVYAGAAGQVLAPTAGNQRQIIHNAIDRLQAGGSTNGAAGIHLAYQLAEQNFLRGGVNRVILATDGDFNVGTTDIKALERLVAAKREGGVALTVLGFGTGNYNDHLMQKIAQIGNGNAAYIDTMSEARKVLVDELSATLNIIAKDMKIQIEFNPKVVANYRLIGYETRHLEREDFNNDRVDAGEVGAGHTVTALYELTLVDSANPQVDPSRYDRDQRKYTEAEPRFASNDEVAFLRLRYKRTDAAHSKLLEHPLYVRDIKSSLDNTSNSFRFSAAVAWLGQQLRQHPSLQDRDVNSMIRLAERAKGQDPFGYRSEFVNLARIVQALSPVARHHMDTMDDHG